MATELEPQLARAIIEQSADAVIFADAEGVTRIWNAAATAVFGYTADEVVGQSLEHHHPGTPETGALVRLPPRDPNGRHAT